MEIKQLKTFIAVAQLQSFTQAAQELSYAQSTITTQIQLLEKEFDVKLFERLGHCITLTPEGRRLLPLAEQIIKLSNEAKNVLDHSDEPIGTLAIGAVESLCVMKLPKILKEYRLRYPKVEIALKFGSRVEFLRSLQENTLDIAFFLEKKMNEQDFITEFEVIEPLLLLSAPDHPLSRKDRVFPQDLNDQPLILTEVGCGYRQLFDHMRSQYSIKPRSIIETGNVQTIKQLAISGMGITLLPAIAVMEECEQQRLQKLNWGGDQFEVLTQVLYHKNKWISAPLRVFIELLHEMKF